MKFFIFLIKKIFILSDFKDISTRSDLRDHPVRVRRVVLPAAIRAAAHMHRIERSAAALAVDCVNTEARIGDRVLISLHADQNSLISSL